MGRIKSDIGYIFLWNTFLLTHLKLQYLKQELEIVIGLIVLWRMLCFLVQNASSLRVLSGSGPVADCPIWTERCYRSGPRWGGLRPSSSTDLSGTTCASHWSISSSSQTRLGSCNQDNRCIAYSKPMHLPGIWSYISFKLRHCMR